MKRHGGNLRKTDLDAVRETENEDGKNSKKRDLSKSVSRNHFSNRSRNNNLMNGRGS